MNAGAYIRVSQKGDGDSANEQRAHIARRAEADGASIAREVVHENVSGGTSSADRLKSLRDDADIEVVYLIDVSRLSREGAWQAVATCGDIVASGKRLVGVLDGFDSDAPGAAVVLAAQAEAAKSYLETVRARWNHSRTRAMSEGRFPGCIAFGYRKRGDGTVEVHPTNGPLVTEAFEAKAAGASNVESAAILNRGEGKHWTPQAAARLLKSRTYLGTLTKGDIDVSITVTPLTDLGTFEAAQSPTRVVDKRTATAYLLGGGICRCDGCGYTLSRKDGVFKCVNGRTRGCTAPAEIDYDEAERLVADAVVRPYRSIEVPVALAKDETPKLAAAQARAQRQYDDAKSPDMQDAFGDDWAGVVAERKRAVAEATAALAKAKATASKRPRGTTNVAAKEWDGATLAERIAFLRRDVDLVSVDTGGRVTIWHPGTLPADLPMQGRRSRSALAAPLGGIGIVDERTGVRWVFAGGKRRDLAPRKLDWNDGHSVTNRISA